MEVRCDICGRTVPALMMREGPAWREIQVGDHPQAGAPKYRCAGSGQALRREGRKLVPIYKGGVSDADD